MQPLPAQTRAAASPAAHVTELDHQCMQRSIDEALNVLEGERDEDVAALLTLLHPPLTVRLLDALPEERRGRLLALVPQETRDQWKTNAFFPEESIGRLMEPPRAMLAPDVTVREARERLRTVVARALVSYAWVVDATQRLLGVLVFRDLFFADERARVDAIMIREPFFLRPEIPLLDAMREVLALHFPVYPVLIGQAANTGTQALAVTLRGITLGEDGQRLGGLVGKEAWLGVLNGAGTGLSAALAMIVFARLQGHP